MGHSRCSIQDCVESHPGGAFLHALQRVSRAVAPLPGELDSRLRIHAGRGSQRSQAVRGAAIMRLSCSLGWMTSGLAWEVWPWGFMGEARAFLSGTFRGPLVPLLLIPKINLSSGKNNKQHRRACVWMFALLLLPLI